MDFDSHMPVQRQPGLLGALHGRLPHGVGIFDTGLRLIYANPSWSSFQKHAAACAPTAGTPFPHLLPGEDLHAAARHCASAGETVQFRGRPFINDGGETSWDITLAPLIEGGAVSGLICVVDDATARVLAERAAAAKARLAAFRAEVSQALASSDEIDAVLQSCAEAMVRHAPAAFARIWVLDETEDIYQLRASVGLYTRLNGTYSRIPADWIRQRESTFPVHEPGMAVDVLRTHYIREPEWASEQGIVSWATHPLIARGRVVGFTVMFARQNFDDDTLNELAAVADAIAQFLERKRAETELREREMLFRGVFESAADGLVISDLATGRLLAANPALCTIHGYSQDEITRLSRTDLIHPDSHDRLAAYVSAIDAGQAARAQLLGVRKDGTVFHLATQGSPILYRGRAAVLGVVRDVTQEQEAHEGLEQRVAERTHELRTLLDMSRNISLRTELNPLLELIFDQMRQIVDYESVAIGLIEGDRYAPVAVRRDETGLRSGSPLGAQFAVDRSQFLWRELAAGNALSTPNIAGDDEVAAGFRALVGERLHTTYAHVRSLLAAPLIVGHQLIGAVFISSAQEARFQPHDIDLVATTANQIAVAIENARLHQRARTMAALEERQRLARELHDSVSQALFGIGLGAETARAMLERDPAKARQPIEYVLQLARGGMAEMRALIFELRPESLAQEGLVAALEKQAAATRARHTIAFDLSLGDEPEIPLEMKEALYRIAQEAMHNTVKHAHASTIALRLVASENEVAMDVIDDGAGFDSRASFPGHLGLVSMQERVACFGGQIAINSEPGAGTRVHVTIPLRPTGRQPQLV